MFAQYTPTVSGKEKFFVSLNMMRMATTVALCVSFFNIIILYRGELLIFILIVSIVSI